MRIAIMPLTHIHMGGTMTPRGIRNHNPGNIERTRDRWLGMAADQSADPRFVVFDTPEHGIRALIRLLINYQERHGARNVTEIIYRWAPPMDVDQNGHSKPQATDAYVIHVANALGVGVLDDIDMLDKGIAIDMARAIVRHENGRNPISEDGEWYEGDVYERAAVLAGFAPDKRPLSKSRTLISSATAAVATVAGAVHEAGPEAVGQAAQAAGQAASVWPGVAHWVFAGIAIAAIAVAIYARIDDQRKRLT